MATPRYAMHPGRKVRLMGRTLTHAKTMEYGYECIDDASHEVEVVPFGEFARLLRHPSTKIEKGNFGLEAAIAELQGGHRIAETLGPRQMREGRFRRALCRGMEVLAAVLYERGLLKSPDAIPTIKQLNDSGCRRIIAEAAEEWIDGRISIGTLRGGKASTIWVMMKGRSLRDLLVKHRELCAKLGLDGDYDVELLALCPRDHLKGNRTARIHPRMRELVVKAIEELGLDLRKRHVQRIHDLSEAYRIADNEVRRRNGLPLLKAVSRKAVSDIRKDELSPTELAIALDGMRVVQNTRGRGRMDVRALMVGDIVEIDECRLSCVIAAKEHGLWAGLTKKQRTRLKDVDAEVKKRFVVLVALDIASGMPMGWVVSDEPREEATIACLRMATRDKTKEKDRYGCVNDPLPMMGIKTLKNDNANTLRTAGVKEGIIALGTDSIDTRAYAPGDKSGVERHFWTKERILLVLQHGFTGGWAGELPGYDATASVSLDVDMLYEELSRYFIDEYPSLRNMGMGKAGRRPAELFKRLIEDRGLALPIDPDDRRRHLGWKDTVTPQPEGVRVFGGLWYNSADFQKAVDGYKGKVDVWIDPDQPGEATVVIPRNKTVFRLLITTTVFADMTVPEILNFMEDCRREHPATTKFYDDLLSRLRLDRHDKMKRLGVEKGLPRSYATIAECKRKALSVFAGASVVAREEAKLPGTVDVDAIADDGGGFEGFMPTTNESDPNDPFAGLRSTNDRDPAPPVTQTLTTDIDTDPDDGDEFAMIGRPTDEDDE